MIERVRERAHWLARNILPHEPAIRAWLNRGYLYGLDIDDVIQEMYAKIISLETPEAIRYPKRYAFQTANSIVIDHMRRSRIVSIRAAGDLEQLDVPAPDANPQEQMEFREEIQQIATALATLPETCRETLILRRVEGLSQRETARRLGISEKTVENHMARGVWLLMSLFGRGGKQSTYSSKVAKQVQLENDGKTVQPRD
jgi:RNA polymerase sigma factor (sigma-70 family)